MKAAALLLALLLAGCGPLAKPACQQTKARAEVMERAAQICVTELVGCSLSFEDVQAVVKAKRDAEKCK